jgi:hypothetical protein
MNLLLLSKEMIPIGAVLKEGLIKFREDIEYNFDYSREVLLNSDEVNKNLKRNKMKKIILVLITLLSISCAKIINLP